MESTPRQPMTGDATTDHRLRAGAVIVKAWAPWCGSCRALGPIVDHVADQTDVPVIGLQVDVDPTLADRLTVRSVPTLIALRDGVEVGRLVGLQTSESVQSLFGVVTGSTARVDRVAPVSLVASRAAAGVVVVGAGIWLGSLMLGVVGAGLAGWALWGLVRP